MENSDLKLEENYQTKKKKKYVSLSPTIHFLMGHSLKNNDQSNSVVEEKLS